MLQRIVSTDPGIPFPDRVSRVGSILLPILGFLAPLSGPAGTAVAVVMVLLFFLRGSLGTTLRQILANKIVLAVLIFFVLHLIGLFWTEDIRSGLRAVNKQWRLLLIPMLMAFVRKDHTQLYIDSFIGGMTIVHLVSYLHRFQVISFEIMDRISYNPLLAWCLYLLGCSSVGASFLGI